MTELEKVEKLREKADVSFSEAKEALDASNGDILDALIYLENCGKAVIPAGGGFFSGDRASYSERQPQPEHETDAKANTESFGDMLKRFGRFCLMVIRKGNRNFLEASKDGAQMFSCPVTIVVLFLLFFFWVTVPLFIISLFFGLRYRFRGSELGKESVNRVMDNASGVVDEVKKSFTNQTNDNNNDSVEE